MSSYYEQDAVYCEDGTKIPDTEDYNPKRDEYVAGDIIAQGAFGRVVRCRRLKKVNRKNKLRSACWRSATVDPSSSATYDTPLSSSLSDTYESPLSGSEAEEDVAIKVVSAYNRRRKVTCDREIESLKRVTGFKFFLELTDYFATNLNHYIVTKYVSGVSLKYIVEQEQPNGGLSDEAVNFYLAELCVALRVAHQKNIVHADVKPNNILVDSEGHIVLTDFGCSEILKQESDHPAIGKDCRSKMRGTPHFIAPEIYNKQPYDYVVDWWGYGVTGYYLATGKRPFGDHLSNVELIKRSILEDPLSLTDLSGSCTSVKGSLQALLTGLLQKSPTQRLGSRGDAAEIQGHVYFQHLDWTTVANKELTPPILPTQQTHGSEASSTMGDEPEDSYMPQVHISQHHGHDYDTYSIYNSIYNTNSDIYSNSIYSSNRKYSDGNNNGSFTFNGNKENEEADKENNFNCISLEASSDNKNTNSSGEEYKYSIYDSNSYYDIYRNRYSNTSDCTTPTTITTNINVTDNDTNTKTPGSSIASSMSNNSVLSVHSILNCNQKEHGDKQSSKGNFFYGLSTYHMSR
uniref:Serine/threonine-protein kinase psk1-like n=1 Tax=Hirondellea gigas TaxID=1518452 RepID=A0A2P2I8F6_9CRUS